MSTTADLTTVTGTHSEIADFREGLLDSLDTESVRFLTRTAVLDRLSGLLCDFLLETTGSAATLTDVVDRNLFVYPWTATVSGSATTICLPSCCGPSCAAGSRARSLGCTRGPRRGSSATNWSRRPSTAPGSASRPARAHASWRPTPTISLRQAGSPRSGRGSRPSPTPTCAPAPTCGGGHLGLGAQRRRRTGTQGLGGGRTWDVRRRRRDGSASLESGLAMIRAALAPQGVERMLTDAHEAFSLEPPGSPWRPQAALLLGCARLLNGLLDGGGLAFGAGGGSAGTRDRTPPSSPSPSGRCSRPTMATGRPRPAARPRRWKSWAGPDCRTPCRAC